MNDLISRAELLERIAYLKNTCTAEVFEAIHSITGIESAPVVYGRWIRSGGGWMCKPCGYQTADDTANMILCNYCPSCGARMDGESR